ncbi:anaerobic sulfatase maturase, partial [Vibrio parahaemolyticus]
PIVEFAWHGGEPTLIGIDFFEKAVEFQKQYANGKLIKNTIQTNGSKLNSDWCRFFRENNFLVGLSLDGP